MLVGRARVLLVALIVGGVIAGCGLPPVGSGAGGPTSSPATDDGSAPGRTSSTDGDLAAVVIAPDGPLTGYDRVTDFGGWTPTGPGCDTRDAILTRDLTGLSVRHGCDVTAGTLHSSYSGATLTGPTRTVQIDHRVPLALAWRTGAARWTPAERITFANDPNELVAVEGALNESKGDSGPEAWAPPTGQCQYARAFVDVLVAYHLTATAARRAALARMIATCPAG